MPSRPAVVLAALAIGLAGGALLRGAASPVRAGPQEKDPVETATAVAEVVIDKVVEQVVLPPRVSWDDPLLPKRVIVICGEINRNTVHEAIAKILHIDSEPMVTRPIDLYIRTNGGWGDDAYALADAMRAVRSPVNTWALGSADSAGAIVLAAGTGRRRVGPHTVVSIHFNEDEGGGTQSEEKTGREREEAFWRARARLPEEFFPVTGEKEFHLSAAETVKYGVADEVYDLHPEFAPKAPEGK